MNKMSPAAALRRSRTSVAVLLAYLVLFAPLAPVSAQGVKVKRAPAPQSAPQQGKGKEATGGNKNVTLPTAIAAPNITATKVDSFPDPDADGKALPGDTITYTVTIQNTGPDPATGVTFTDTVDPNTSLVPGSTTTTPIANADAASAFGNVRISTANGAPNLLANDCDPDPAGGPCTNAGLTASGPTTSANNGNVVVSSNGDFSYNPAPGFTGSDTFTYTVTDGGGKTDTAVVTITVGPTLVWFINNDPAASAGNDGRITSPFNSIAAYNASSPTKDPNDIIFIYQGTSAYTGNLTLVSGMKLIGQGFALQTETGAPPAGSDPLPAATANPVINSTGNTVTLNTNNTVRGLTLNDSTGIDLIGSGFGTLTVSNVTLSGTGRPLSLTTGALAATFDQISSTSSTGGAGINLAGVSGTMGVTNGTSITNPSAQCILVGTTTANINFGNTSCSGGTDGVSFSNNSSGTRTFGTLGVSGGSGNAFLSGAGGGNVTVSGAATLTSTLNPVEIQNSAAAVISFAGGATVNKTTAGGAGINWGGTNTGGTLSFASLALTTSNGSGLVAAGGGTVSITTGSISSTGSAAQLAPAINANGVTLNATFTSVTSTNSGTTATVPGNGISLTNVAGTLTMNGGSITGAAGASFIASGGTGSVTYNGTITQTTAARVIDVSNKSGGTYNFGGAITSNNGTGLGVFLNSNTGATFNFTGGLSLSTAANPAFTATAGGTVNVCDESPCNPNATGALVNTLTTTTGIALNVNATTIGSNRLEFRSISANGATKGVSLNTTGSGGLIVVGTGTTAGSGGTIQNISQRGAEFISSNNITLKNMNFTNANTTDGAGTCDDATITGCNAAIFLDTVSTVSLDRILINGTISQEGINGNAVNGLTLSNSTIGASGQPCGGEVEEGCFKMRQLTGTSSITNSTLSFAAEDVVEILNQSGSLIFNVSGSTFSDTQPNPPGSTGMIVRAAGTSSITLNVINSNFLRIRSIGINATAQDAATLDADVSGNTVDSTNATNAAFGLGIGIALASNNTAHMVFNIQNNPTISSMAGGAISVLGDGTSTFTGRINNNPNVRVRCNANIVGACPNGGVGTPIAVQTNNNAVGIVEVKNNVLVTNANDQGLAAIAGGKLSGVGGTLDVTISGNNITTNANALYDIETRAGGFAAGDQNTVCANVATNAASWAAQAAGIAAYRARVGSVGATLKLQGFNTNAATTWINNGNTPANAAAVSQSVVGGGNPIVGCTALIPGNPALDADGPVTATVNRPAGDAQVASAGAPSSDITAAPFVSLPQSAKPAKAGTQIASAPQVAPINAEQAPVSKTEGGSAKTSSPSSAKPSPVVVSGSGGTVSINIGTLNSGDSVTITFQVVVDNPYSGPANVSNQGTVSGSNFTSVLTDDPSVAGAANPTLTPILTPPDIRVNDAKVTEPASGTANMLFTVTLSHSYPSAITVNFATADGGSNPALGGTSCSDPGVDYLTANGVVTFAAGQTVATIAVPVCADADGAETDETLLVNLSNSSNGAITDAQATGTITTVNTPGTLLISELRTSGPGASGTGDADDDFVELYNNSASPVTVNVTDGSGGWGVYKSGSACVDSPVLVGVVPNNTTIPGFGHFLLTGSGYSLSSYPAGKIDAPPSTATGNAQLNATPASPNIEADRNVAVFSTASPANISSANRLDAVGFTPANTSANCDLLREGTNLPGAGVGAITAQYSFLRRLTSGTSQDTNDNAADLLVVSTTTAAVGSNTPTLGAPGPENLASPVLRTSQVKASSLDSCQLASSSPNRVRDLNPYTDPAAPTGSGTGAYPLGTLSFRRTFTNSTASSVTRLRFRVVDITTAIAPAGVADMRVLTSPNINVTLSAACGGATVPVKGTTLETPPAQPNGGGLNSTLSVGTISLAQPLAPGATVNVQLLTGLKQTGSFRFFIIVEGLP